MLTLFPKALNTISARVSALGDFLEKVHESEFWRFLRVRSHRATYPSNRATVALLLRRCKSFGTRYVWPCGRVTGPQGHLSTLFRRFARAARKSVILLLHKATVGLWSPPANGVP